MKTIPDLITDIKTKRNIRTKKEKKELEKRS